MRKTHLYRAQTLVVLMTLVVSLVQPLWSPLVEAQRDARSAASALAPAPGAEADSTGLYRTEVVFRNPSERKRLTTLGVRVLQEGPDWAVVLVDGAQLETLARLRYQPRRSMEMGTLVNAHAPYKPWLSTSLGPVMTRATALSRQKTLGALSAEAETASLRQMAQGLSPEQATGIASLSSVDDDGDGLTNTQERTAHQLAGASPSL